jgi:hypothetical protein
MATTPKTPIQKLFTYNVSMLVQIFAEDEKSAKAKLDSEGGFVSKRDVELVNTAELYNAFFK